MAIRDKYNASGCLDMTSYLALKRISREERKHKSKKYNNQTKTNNSSKGENKYYDNEFFFLR